MENLMLKDIKEYFSLNLNDYENINVNFEINKFLFILAIALCVMTFVVNYRRSLIIDTVRQLFRHNATDSENAKTLAELGLSGSRGIRKALVSDSQLRKMVAIVGEVRPTYEEYVAAMKKKKGKDLPTTDLTDARIYIPAESLDRAKHVYNSYSTSLLKTILVCIFIIAISVCMILLSPSILTAIDTAMAA